MPRNRCRIPITPEMEAQLRAFWPTDEPIRMLAKEWKVSKAYVSIKAKELGLPSRAPRRYELQCRGLFKRFEGKLESIEYLNQQAAIRGMNRDVLERILIRTIANEHLVDAVLDDVDELIVKQHHVGV